MGTDKVKSRGDYFLAWLNFFNMPAQDDLDCGNQPSAWPAESSSDITMFFDKDWSGGKKCKLVSWQTQYSSVARDDYKRCVCDNWGNGATDCPQGENDTSNQSVVVPDSGDDEEPEDEQEQS